MKKYFKKIYMEITNVCNAACVFCPKTSRNPAFMSFLIFDKILNKIHNYTEHLCFHIMGEPLLHPELELFLDTATEKNFKVNLTTNGFLLNKFSDIFLKKKNIRQLNISLHCDKKNVSDLDDYYAAIFDFIEKNSQNNNIIISLRLWNLKLSNPIDAQSAFLTKENEHILKKIEKRFNLDYEITGKINLKTSGCILNGLKISDTFYLNFAEQFDWPDLTAEKFSSKGFCYALRDHIGILVDGTVTPCCLDRNGVIALGNINSSDLDEILFSPRAVKMFNGFSQRKIVEELCLKCGYIQRFNTKNTPLEL